MPATGLARAGAPPGGTQFCRVTVLAPRSRMDLALPVDLTVAELVPMLLELAGEVGPRWAGAGGAWCLASVAGAELPAGATLAGLGVLDGDLLRLRGRADAPPPPVFDDPVDAVAEAVRSPDGEPSAWGERDLDAGGDPEPLAVRPWNDRCRRPAGLLGTGLTGVLAALLLAAVRGPGPDASPLIAVIAVLAGCAALTSALRTMHTDPAAAAALAFCAVPLAGCTGFAALPGPPGTGHLLLCTALAAATASAGLALLGTAVPVLVGVVLASVLAALAGLLGMFIGFLHAPGLAALVAAIAIGLLPVLPRFSVRLAGLPPPVIPTTPEDLVLADQQWEVASPEEVRYQSRLAHAYLTGLVLGASVAAGVGAVLAVGAGGWAGPAFGAVVVAVLLLRSRGYITACASAAPLVTGSLAATALGLELARHGPTAARIAVALGLLVVGSVSLWSVWTGPRRQTSPVLRKFVDIVEAVLVVAAFPLALGVLNLYDLVRNLA
ncbi:MAG TPA: type VII secretion integral membrane protein EccD [Pseudonocardia sp.]